MIKVIIFDFDGVIADSNNVKTQAFVELFKDHPRHITESVRKFHLENGGMSRFDKFRYIYKNFIKEPLPEYRFKELCAGFNALVMDGVINAPIFDGVIEFLEKNKDNYLMHIVSGTPEQEIREIAKRRRLDKYFLNIYGSPRSKKELIDRLVEDNNYNREEVVFLGDSINDYEGAMGAGVEFVAKIDKGLGVEQFPGVDIKTKIETIAEFEEYLRENNG
ncbi:HAD family hydrolase [Candidatus Omnitrophota bacterium]